MGKLYSQLDEKLVAWIEKQKMFFVATAPLAAAGHVNLSPKGFDSFRILGPTTVAYLDMTGSGAETIAHLRENGRMTFLFCAFDGPPKIVRLYGQGRIVLPEAPEFEGLIAKFPAQPGTRSIIVCDVNRITDSCGFTVPFLDYVGERDTMQKYVEAKGEEGMRAYRAEKNVVSIDGLPALDL